MRPHAMVTSAHFYDRGVERMFEELAPSQLAHAAAAGDDSSAPGDVSMVLHELATLGPEVVSQAQLRSLRDAHNARPTPITTDARVAEMIICRRIASVLSSLPPLRQRVPEQAIPPAHEQVSQSSPSIDQHGLQDDRFGPRQAHRPFEDQQVS